MMSEVCGLLRVGVCSWDLRLVSGLQSGLRVFGHGIVSCGLGFRALGLPGFTGSPKVQRSTVFCVGTVPVSEVCWKEHARRSDYRGNGAT